MPPKCNACGQHHSSKISCHEYRLRNKGVFTEPKCSAAPQVATSAETPPPYQVSELPTGMQPDRKAMSKVPVGYWFFYDSPSCTQRYSIQLRTNSGCSIVCSSPYTHDGVKKDLLRIVALYNAEKAATEPVEQAPRPQICNGINCLTGTCGAKHAPRITDCPKCGMRNGCHSEGCAASSPAARPQPDYCEVCTHLKSGHRETIGGCDVKDCNCVRLSAEPAARVAQPTPEQLKLLCEKYPCGCEYEPKLVRVNTCQEHAPAAPVVAQRELEKSAFVIGVGFGYGACQHGKSETLTIQQAEEKWPEIQKEIRAASQRTEGAQRKLDECSHGKKETETCSDCDYDIVVRNIPPQPERP